MQIGKMKNLFTWLKQSTSKENTYGQAKEVFTSNGTLYGWVEELSGTELLAFGIKQSQANLKVHLRMQDATGLAAVDRLQDTRTGDVLWVDGVNLNWQTRELIAYCHIYRSTGANP